MKKNFQKLVVTALFAVVFLSVSTFAKDNNSKELQIKTSAFSFMCKSKIETALKDLKGVEDSYLSLDDQIVTITYDTTKVKPELLQSSIKDLGYDADFINVTNNKAESKDENKKKEKLN